MSRPNVAPSTVGRPSSYARSGFVTAAVRTTSFDGTARVGLSVHVASSRALRTQGARSGRGLPSSRSISGPRRARRRSRTDATVRASSGSPSTRAVLRTACAEAAKWPNQTRVAVNLSPLQFSNAALPSLVMNVLASSGLPANRLELEITEGVLLNDDAKVH
ncbi:MAG: EAL domain-containing protein, partial [Gemmatimonadetes bacterium]|nr:EAL domain-containing protein [Gemmatimonadota bacterium]